VTYNLLDYNAEHPKEGTSAGKTGGGGGGKSRDKDEKSQSQTRGNKTGRGKKLDGHGVRATEKRWAKRRGFMLAQRGVAILQRRALAAQILGPP